MTDERPTAGADGVHGQHLQIHRPRTHLRLVPDLRLTVHDQADVRRRAAHVDTDGERRLDVSRHLTGRFHARGGTRECKRKGQRHGGFRRHHATRRMKQFQAQIGREELVQRGDVIGHHRHHARIQHRGERPLVLLELRPHLMGQRNVRKELPAQLAHGSFVLAVGVGMQQRDRDRIGRAVEASQDVPNLVRIQRSRDAAVRSHASVDFEPQFPRYRSGLTGKRRQIVKHPSRLPRDVEDIAVSGGGEQCHAPRLTLDDGIGDDGRAERQHPHVRRFQIQGLEGGRDSRPRVVLDAPDLGGPGLARRSVVRHHVRERAADVDAEVPVHGMLTRPLLGTGIPSGPRLVETMRRSRVTRRCS